MAPIDLSNRSIVVLGGTGSLGSRIVSELARRGALVTVAARNHDKAQGIAASVGGVSATVDFLDSATFQDPFDKALASYGHVGGIVNAVGVVAFGPLAGSSERIISQVVAVNLTAPLAIYAKALPRMNGGFVLNLSGVVATLPTAGMATYSASKAGLSAATMALARESRRDGIAVIDARLPHIDSGLVGRALTGVPPSLPEGLDPDMAVIRLVDGVEAGARVLEPEWFRT